MAKKQYKPQGKEQVVLDLGKLNPKQQEFVNSTAPYTCFGGAKGGGKTHVVRVKAALGAIQYPGIRILIIRRQYPELQSNHIEPFVKMIPRQLGDYNGQYRAFYFRNGSIIRFGHFDGPKAQLEYNGQEFDWIFIDEATQFTEDEFRFLKGCVRGVNNFPKQMFLTCNPGGVGHNWVKRLFIDRDYRVYPDEPERTERPEDYKFIFARAEDNEIMIAQDPHYLERVSQMPEHLYKAYRYGDWEAIGGGYFPELGEKHIIEPFPIPSNWVKYRAIDYGLDMTACLWIAVDYKGRCYVYREFFQGKDNGMEGLIASEAAEKILERTLPGERISATFAPTDIWNTQKDTGKSAAEVMMFAGLNLVRASRNRVQGWLQVKEYLRNMPDGIPRLLIFNTCKTLIKCMKEIQVSEKDPDDCATEPHEITHAPDALRYFCISRSLPSEEKSEVINEEEILEAEVGGAQEDYDEFMTGGEPTASYLNYR